MGDIGILLGLCGELETQSHSVVVPIARALPLIVLVCVKEREGEG